MPLHKEHEDPAHGDDPSQARKRFLPLTLFHDDGNEVTCNTVAVVHVRQALRSFLKMRKFLSTHLFRSFCSAHVNNCAYADVPGTSGIGPTDGEWPSEDVIRHLLPDAVTEDEARDGFDYSVLRLLWPRRDLSTLEDLTRLVTIFKTILAEEGHGKVRLYIDLLYRAGAGGVDGPEGPDRVGRLRYRDRLWTASQLADVLLKTI